MVAAAAEWWDFEYRVHRLATVATQPVHRLMTVATSLPVHRLVTVATQLVHRLATVATVMV